VSGGGYIAIAYPLLVSETHRSLPEGADEGTRGQLLGRVSPWAPSSPEERHLRNDSSYLANGIGGKLWFALNFIVGFVKHLLPFGGLLCVLGVSLGWLFWWTFLSGLLSPPSWAILLPAIAGGVGLLMAVVRVTLPSIRKRPALLTFIWAWSKRLLIAAALLALVLVGLPALLAGLDRSGAFRQRLTTAGLLSAVTTLYGIYRAHRKLANEVLRAALILLTTLLGPLTLLIPLAYLARWGRGQGLHCADWPRCLYSGPIAPPIMAVSAGVVVIVYSALRSELVPSMHLFYRERLAGAFVRYRKQAQGRLLTQAPPWERPINLSQLETTNHAKLPKLVVCAAVNLSGSVVPPGRSCASFTFETDRSGGPVTGYVKTSVLESATGKGILTLPAMIGNLRGSNLSFDGQANSGGASTLVGSVQYSLGGVAAKSVSPSRSRGRVRNPSRCRDE
jgi:hypothetical protein